MVTRDQSKRAKLGASYFPSLPVIQLGSPRSLVRMMAHRRRHHVVRSMYQKNTKKEGTLEQNSKGGIGGRMVLDKR